MKFIVLALLILLTFQQDSVLASSGDSSAQVTENTQGSQDQSSFPPASPPPQSAPPSSSLSGDFQQQTQPVRYKSAVPLAPSDWNFLSQNSLGGNSVWKTPVAGSRQIYPRYWRTTYTITFSTDCLSPVNLKIGATGYFQVYLNGTLIKDWQAPWPSSSNIQFTPLCGCNKITVVVCNCYWESPAAICYTLTQNTAGCYNCPSSATFYNRDTCRCQCAATGCLNPYMQLSPQTCTCQCSPQRSDSSCRSNQFWSRRNCSCLCKKICCPTGYSQNPSTCQCQHTPCYGKCNGYANWNPQTCSCQCRVSVQCPYGYFNTNPNVCNCQGCPYFPCGMVPQPQPYYPLQPVQPGTGERDPSVIPSSVSVSTGN